MKFKGIFEKNEFEKGWMNNNDPYGSAIFQFALDWSNEMERRIEIGKSLEQVADECFNIADDRAGGITGYMYGCAVSILTRVWIHGDTLRIWHNSQYGDSGRMANESGCVINPALICIGVRDNNSDVDGQ